MNVLRKPFRFGAVYWIIGITALVFLGEMILGSRFVQVFLGMRPGLVLHGWVWSFVTYLFVHDGISHILFNMFALFVFGVPVEKQMGSGEFLFFYFFTGVLAGVFSFVVYLFTGGQNVNLIGASGAVFAVQLAFAVMFPGAIIYLLGILPLRAPVMVLGFTGIEVILMLTGLAGNVAHITHLAGFGFAWIYFLIRGVNPWRRLTGR